MRKLMSFVLALTFLTSMAFSAGFASAAPAKTDRLAAIAAQEVGDTVIVNDIDGNEVATATIDDIIDPFEDMRQNPEAGLRFLSVELTVENTGDDALTVSPGNIGIVDDKGIIYVDVAVDRTDDLESLEESEVDSGDSISGALEVGFPEDGEIAQIIWLVGQGQLPILYNNLEPVAEGDPVTLYTTDYSEEAILTADDVVDDFDDLRDGKKASRGFKFVGVTVTFENVSEDPIRPDPASVFLGTSDGIFWAQDTQIDRSDDSLSDVPYLVDTPLAPGDSVTGFVGFSIPADLEISYVMYLPDSIRLIHIFDADTGRGSRSGDDGTPSADDDKDTGGLGPLGRKTPTPADDDAGGKTPRASGDECAGAADWEDITIETLGIWGGVFQDLDLQNPNAETITQIEDGIDTIRDAADQQENSDPPPAAEELNDLITEAYTDSADALEQILDAIDTDDSELLNQALSDIGAIGESFTSGDVADVLEELKSTCPAIDEL